MGFFDAALSAAASYFGQQEANDTNVQLATENREWQASMSNTAHQREVADLQRAGLNPMLSAMKGGASTPTGSVARVESATKDAVNSGASASLLSATIDKLKAETGLAQAGAQERLSQADANRGYTAPAESTMGLQSQQGYHLGFQNAELSARGVVHSATVRHLDAQVDQLGRQGKLTEEEVRHVKQRIGESSAHELESVLRSMHSDLDLQRARNHADAELSWWKKNVAPYLSDSSKVISSAGALAGAGALGHRLGSSVNSGRAASKGLVPGPAPGLRIPADSVTVPRGYSLRRQ